MDSLWSKDISELQNFSFEIAETFFKSKGWTRRNSGYRFFAEGYIHEVFVYELKRTIMAKCHKSQEKNEKPHSIYLTLTSSMEAITEAYCTCEAGDSECCDHVVALAYFLQHLILLEFKTIPEDASPTFLRMTWDNKPTNQDWTKLNADGLANLKSELQKYDKDIPFASTLCLNQTKETNYVLFKNEVYVPANSALGHQARASFQPPVLPELEEPSTNLIGEGELPLQSSKTFHEEI